MIETSRIEFKRELTRELDIEKEIVAFLNYREGGMLYIGIDDNGEPVGVKDITAPDDTIIFGSVNGAFGSVKHSEPTQRQLNILSVIANGNATFGRVNGSVKKGLTTKDIVSKLNLSERTIYRELAVLKQLGLVVRVGSDKTGHWEVTKK